MMFWSLLQGDSFGHAEHLWSGGVWVLFQGFTVGFLSEFRTLLLVVIKPYGKSHSHNLFPSHSKPAFSLDDQNPVSIGDPMTLGDFNTENSLFIQSMGDHSYKIPPTARIAQLPLAMSKKRHGPFISGNVS